MDFKILFAAFSLIFIAELGDKTQLAALAFTTSAKSPWMVFLGTSLALICATALAVAFGEVLSNILPPRILQIVSAVLFILVGVFLLVNLARKVPDEGTPSEGAAAGSMRGEDVADVSPAAAEASGLSGIVTSFIVEQAARMEGDILSYLSEIASDLDEGRERETVEKIIAEDRRHVDELSRIRELKASSEEGDTGVRKRGQAHIGADSAEVVSILPGTEHLCYEAGKEPVSERIRKAIEIEEAASDFFIALARRAKIHTARDAFRLLAMEDIRHAQELCSLVNQDDDSGIIS